MISVCIATYNGEKYIREQIESILPQLGDKDEVIISDDSSTDNTIQIIQSFDDTRIKIFSGNIFHSPVFNFENALKYVQGEYIFLCDQDDVWASNKVEMMLSYLKEYDLVVSDCCVTDENLKVIGESFYKLSAPKKGFWSNLIKNHYMGCCMAFKRSVLEIALPFPPKVALHDIWIGLCAEAFFNTKFIPDKLLKYRRHGDNASSTAGKSCLSIRLRIAYRIYLLKSIVVRKFQHF